MKYTKSSIAVMPHRAAQAALVRRAGNDPSLRGERATGRVRAAVRKAEGGAAWA